MGLARREARRRLDAVLEFAELRGLRRAQAQELLVGDDGAAGLRDHGPGRRRHHARSTRCSRSATRRSPRSAWTSSTRSAGARHARSCSSRTTWRRCSRSATARCCSTTASSCTAATPADTALRYFRLNFDAPGDAACGEPAGGVMDVNVDVVDAWLADAAGERVRQRRAGDADRPARSLLEARRDLVAPVLGIHVLDELGATVFGFNRRLDGGRASGPGAAGGRVRVGGTIENRLVARPLLRRLLGRRAAGEQRRLRAAAPAAARLRRLRHRAAPGAVTVDADVRGRARVRRAGAQHEARSAPELSCARSAARRRSAAAGGARCELLLLIAVTDFKRTYFGTALGYLWSLARPLLLFGVLLAVFTQAFQLGERVPSLSRPAAVQHRAVRLLPGGDGRGRRLDPRAGVGRAQDAVPARS